MHRLPRQHVSSGVRALQQAGGYGGICSASSNTLEPPTMKQPPSIEKARQALGQFLEALGYDLAQPHLAETPTRVVDAYLNDLVVGERADIARLIEQGSVAGTADSLVIVRDITTMTMCPHHLLPAQGQA